MIVGYARLFRELAAVIGADRARATRSRTLHELMAVGELVNRIVPYALEGQGRVFVDA